MRLVHMLLSIPLLLASLPALIRFAAVWIREGHDVMLHEHMCGWDALCLLFAVATAVAFFTRGTPQRIRDLVSSSSSSPQPAVSAQSLSPIKRLLDVPDLVGNVFERLDPASRKALFQTHPDVAQNGHVRAHTKLRIELRHHQSWQDQWQHVLRLTRSQPLRCLILSGPNGEILEDFLHCDPEGRQEDKQRVLQGTELQLQIHIKLETGGVPHLQALLASWRNEQQPAVRDTRLQLALDLCGRGFVVTNEGDLEPSHCTLMNGTLKLWGTYNVRVHADRVGLSRMVIKGAGTQQAVVEVVSGGSLYMDECRVEGGRQPGGAVMVHGEGASLSAKRCILKSNNGSGLVARLGSNARLEHVTASGCGFNGVWVIGEGSRVSAEECHMDGNVWGNCAVQGGAHTCLRECSSNSSQEWHGIQVVDAGSYLEASHSSTANSNKNCGILCGDGAVARLSHFTASENQTYGWYLQCHGSSLEASDSRTSRNNRLCGVAVHSGARASLSRVVASENGFHGWYVTGQNSSLRAEDSHTNSNKGCGAAVFSQASASLSRVTAKKNGQFGWSAKGLGSRLEVTSCQATGNRKGDAAEISDGRIFYLDA